MKTIYNKIAVIQILFLSLIILTSCGVQSQENYLEEKKEAIQLIEKLDSLYLSKDEKVNSLFANNIQCSICEIENGYDNQYIIENKKSSKIIFKK
ncbi:hypothetical protein [Chryseobacterium sp. WX]|uniref:hypothetical protein n=1 Tax=Chryseobacterium sp. WX TaxID=3031803 RepID=UPI0024091EEA|nr:hypothetical protein [Chryseobacterium sp. WX]WFB65516.1 hypothetical protein PZ898_12275 [Chryseobacterium sp. WX]